MKSKLILALTSIILLASFALAASISITPSVAYDNDNLVCSVDVNSGAYIYEWYLGNVYKSTGAVLDASNTNVGDIWTCKVFLPPTPWTTKILIGSASRIISNTPTTPINHIPTIPSINLTGIYYDTFYANSVVTAIASSIDADNDSLTYEYFYERAGSNLSNTNTLDCNGICVKGDTINVYARAYDGKDYSAWNSTSFTISNHPPTDISLSYSPQTIYSNTTITVTVNAADSVDNDPIVYYYFQFENLDDDNIIYSNWTTSNSVVYTFDQSSENNDIRIWAMVNDGEDSLWTYTDITVLPIPGTETNQTNITFNYCPINSVNSPIQISEITNIDNIMNNEYNPLENIKIKIKVQNNADTSKTAYVKAIIVKSNNVTVADTEVDKSEKISGGSTKTFELNMTVPVDLAEGTYYLYVKAYDENNRTNCEQRAIPFSVVRKEHKVILLEPKFSSDNVSCGTLLTFSTKLANIGKNDEEKVKITYKDDLKNQFETIINDLEWGMESKQINFDINIPKNATEGKKKATIIVSYEYDSDDKEYKEENSPEYYYFTISGECGQIITVPTTNLSLVNFTVQPETKKSAFSDFISNNWKSILIIAEIVAVFIIIMLILSASKLI